MEVTKRTYQKHKTEKKITVKHYLSNKHTIINRVNSESNSMYFLEYEYPENTLYVQVTYKRKNTKFRSKVPPCHLEELPAIQIFDNLSDVDEYYSVERNDFLKAITRDLNYILWIVNQEIKKNPNFDISELPQVYHNDKYSLLSFIESCLKKEIHEAIFETIPSAKEHWEFSSIREYRIYSNSSALGNLEYYCNLYPQLNYLKGKYDSPIWFLGIYLEQNGIGDMMLMDYHLQDYGIVPTTFFSYVPTFYDYLTNTFQRDLKESLKNEQIANQIITDIDKLILKYYR